MKLQKVSNRYIKAFLQVTGIEDQKVKEYENCFMLFERLFAQKIISVFLLSPVTPRENKKVVFTEILHSIEADTYMCNFVYALLDANRLAVLPTLGAAYRGEVERIKKITPVKVVVAVDLQVEDKKKIETLLQQSLQQEVRIFFEKDSKVLGGLVVYVGHLKVDFSLQSKLKQMINSVRA